MRLFLIKLTSYEFWPWWMFFLPIMPVYLWNAIRLRNAVYFTAANPGIEYGGFFGEKKNEILKEIPEAYLARSVFFKTNEIEAVVAELTKERLEFPMVFKPDVGERGDEVTILRSQEALRKRLNDVNYPFIIQEHINFPIELGVFYTRLPSSSKGRVMSVVQKKFLKVTGDGHSTVAALVAKSNRGLTQLSRLHIERPLVMASIPSKDEEVVVEPIGNHCLGTEFVNGNHLINDKLSAVFDQISLPFKGFYYGRYDLRVSSLEDMYEGHGIKIFELNGVTSEPGHIYDSEMNLLQVYRDLFNHQRVLYQICRENLQLPGQSTKLMDILRRGYQHFFKGKR